MRGRTPDSLPALGDGQHLSRHELSDRPALTVTLKNLSSDGVKLQVDDCIQLPDEFDLLVPVVDTIQQRYRVGVVWRRGDLVGGAFRKPAGLAADVVEAMDKAIEGDRGSREK